MITLDPRHQTQRRQDLGLDLQRDVEIPGYVVGAEGDAGAGPQEHHRALKSDGVVAPIIDNDLRDQLRSRGLYLAW